MISVADGSNDATRTFRPERRSSGEVNRNAAPGPGSLHFGRDFAEPVL